MGSLRFPSGGHESKFLKEAGQSFCIPLMEERLCEEGSQRILENAQDLALKAFLAIRCASRALEKEGEASSSRDLISQIEKDKESLEVQLASEKEKTNSLAKEKEDVETARGKAETRLENLEL